MSKDKRMRILKSERILSQFLEEGEEFYVALLFEDFINSPNLEKFKIPKTSTEDIDTIIPAPKGSVTKANIKGKFVRKQPEQKTTKNIEIDYVRKDGRRIHYFRDFDVYIKELLHQYHIPLSFKTNSHNQKLVVSPLLKFDNSPESNMQNTHVINMFCEIFNDFEIFNTNLDPAIKFNKKFDQVLLRRGKLSNEENFVEIVEVADRFIRDPQEKSAFYKRLKVIQEFNPDILGKGPTGFFGYLVFGFSDKDIVLLESMYLGNATYVFSTTDYEQNIVRDKQEVLKNKLFKKWFRHDEKWENGIRAYLSSF